MTAPLITTTTDSTHREHIDTNAERIDNQKRKLQSIKNMSRRINGSSSDPSNKNDNGIKTMLNRRHWTRIVLSIPRLVLMKIHDDDGDEAFPETQGGATILTGKETQKGNVDDNVDGEDDDSGGHNSWIVMHDKSSHE
jgi:hypothetical protein